MIDPTPSRTSTTPDSPSTALDADVPNAGAGAGSPREAAPADRPPRWTPSRVRVIWNPASGSKGAIQVSAADEDLVRGLMAHAGLGSDLVIATSASDVEAAARDAVRGAIELVVAAGGDGTVALVANQLLGQETALAILPFGSVMNIARSLGIPRDPEAAADVIATGDVAAIDVGEVAGRPFYETGSVGMNAAMFREAERFDTGAWSSIAKTLWVAFRYRPARMSIDLDGRQIRTRALMVTVSNGPYTGAGMTVAPGARLDDGQFDIRVFRRFSKIRLLRHLVSIAFGRYRYAPEVDTYRSRQVRIESRHPLPARADSHDLETTPVAFTTRPAALRVVVPAAPSDRPTTDGATGG